MQEKSRLPAKRWPDTEASGDSAGEPKQKIARPATDIPSGRQPEVKTAVKWAVSEDKGRRNEFEDRAVANEDGRADKSTATRVAFFAVMDGHAGRRAADFAADRLHSLALEAGLVPEGLAIGHQAIDLQAVKAAVLKAFEKTDAAFLAAAASGGNWSDGAAAAAVWVIGERVVVANVGDVKAVLARQQDQQAALKAVTVTKEHKAIYPAERARIEKAGGSVENGRLAGRLEVSRSFGDAAFKKLGASSVPNITSFELSLRDRFLLVACDGFWNLWSADDAVQSTTALLAEGMDQKAVTNRLLNITVRERRCKDNCTLMLLEFVRSEKPES
mmetsp:Transcript_34318/g.97214  ORF Transcript_34318/g.97214 Transcript_34318/m.97214 type:complete len:330 (+) Transcript_34318:176-1165(+)|eukprot:CAMPEP_0117669664 /NCGR_PEP_ID=MMETSP0804-20121206/12270_1 /TAXON_ID=1074897 /ORGANISM="Tetraselmis astigmatica, Strain CCMP880" /LENGTH=329 /DNA_ID=CAMNT_0005477771 /DNA_START=122 /DNA_END=1111 /DNA_ORIENTATION=-